MKAALGQPFYIEYKHPITFLVEASCKQEVTYFYFLMSLYFIHRTKNHLSYSQKHFETE